MAIPAQIQKQLDEADATLAALAAPTEQKDEPAPAVVDAANDPVPEAPPTPEPETPPAPEAERAVSRDEFQLLEQRYKSLQGMWQSAESRLKHSQAQVAELTQRLDEAITKLNQKPETPKAESALVTDKDTEAFGSDLIDLARRISREEFGTREQQLLAQIDGLKQQLSAATQQVGEVVETQVVTARERFFTDVDTAIPNWEALQASAEGQAWLLTKVPGTKMTWNDALLDAAGQFDAPRAVEVFETFLAAHPQLDARKKAAPQPNKAKDELAKQVAPSRAAAATPKVDGKRSYSSAEYSSEMNRVVALNKARRYDDAQALERELDAALAEGRVAP